MITTTQGDMDEADLMKRTGGHDDENETTTWVEYYLRAGHEQGGKAGELVHRSAHVDLKHMPPGMEAIAANLGA